MFFVFKRGTDPQHAPPGFSYEKEKRRNYLPKDGFRDLEHFLPWPRTHVFPSSVQGALAFKTRIKLEMIKLKVKNKSASEPWRIFLSRNHERLSSNSLSKINDANV